MAVKGPKDMAKALGLPSEADLHRALADLVDNGIGPEGEKTGRKLIEKSPTEGDWTARYRNNPRWQEAVRKRTGRVDSGQMRDDFTYASGYNKGGGEYGVDIGWVEGDAGYYADQEYGFVNTYDGPDAVQVEVQGMGVLPRAREATKKFVDKELPRAVDDAMKGKA